METITNTFSQEHSHCDKQFAQAEASIAKAQWEQGTAEFNAFHTAMERHFTMEEQILFPTIEERTGQTAGPTQVMRMEHQQMRQVFGEMQESCTKQDKEQYLGLSETLLMLMQQHNAKEEQILYPMSDQVLGDEAPSIINKMLAQGDTE
jgi:iron-sulfur cluster repair protein YtfE (RIC family)